MADIQISGFIRSVRYLEEACLVYVDEVKRGYKKPNGVIVDDMCFQWKCIFKSYFKKYISAHFGDGQYIQIKGEILPYAKSHEDIVDGYTIFGQTINLATIPRNVKREIKMRKESQLHSSETPDLNSYLKDDF